MNSALLRHFILLISLSFTLASCRNSGNKDIADNPERNRLEVLTSTAKNDTLDGACLFPAALTHAAGLM